MVAFAFQIDKGLSFVMLNILIGSVTTKAITKGVMYLLKIILSGETITESISNVSVNLNL